MSRGATLRIIRTTSDIPEFDPARCCNGLGFDTEVIYDPWFCVACGHPHHGMTRHHRLPKRVAWKIPETVWREVLKDGQRVVPMCGRCHKFIEIRRGMPCRESRNEAHAKLSYRQLMDEIELFDRIAYERTEELIRQCQQD